MEVRKIHGPHILLIFALLLFFSGIYALAGDYAADYTAFAGEENGSPEVVTVEQYGALGDGKTDDHEAIEKALNSGCKKVVFGQGKTYLISEPVIARSGDIEIDGNGACILWDEESYFEDWKTFVFYGTSETTLKNIYIHDLKFRTPNVGNDPEKVEPLSRIVGVQLLLLHCEKVRVENCEFFAYEGKANKNYTDGGRGITNLWAWGHTDDLKIENCKFSNNCHADGMGYNPGKNENLGGGGNVWLSGDGETAEINELRNVVISNNVFEKSNHDESVSAWNADFYNVSINNNSFTLLDRVGGYVPNDVQFALGYRDNIVKNFVFSENTINAESRDCLFAAYAKEGSDGAIIENNEIHWTHIGEKPSYTGLVVSGGSACPTTVRKNTISVDSEHSDMLYKLFGAICVDFSDNDVHVLCNLHHVCDIENDAQEAADTSVVHDNRFIFDGLFRFFENGSYKDGCLYSGYDFYDNDVLLKGEHENLSLFNYWERTLSRSPKLSGNTIRFTYTPKGDSSRALAMYGTAFGNHKVDFTNNKIYTMSRSEKKEYYLIYLMKGEENSEQCVDARGTKSNFFNSVGYWENTKNPLIQTDSGDAREWMRLTLAPSCDIKIEDGILTYSFAAPASASSEAPLAMIAKYDESGKMSGIMLLPGATFSEEGSLSLAETPELSGEGQRFKLFLLGADTFSPLSESASSETV